MFSGMPFRTKVQSNLAKPFMAPVFFLAGVTYDTLTLTRIDRLQDNLILLLYLALLGFLIILTGRLDAGLNPSEQTLQGSSRLVRSLLMARPYYPMANQFLLGGCSRPTPSSIRKARRSRPPRCSSRS